MTGPRIPETIGVSGTFAALDRHQVATDGLLSFAFEGHIVRAVLVDGDPWFVGPDVARALGYRDAHNLGRRLDADEKGTHSVSTPGGPQNVGIISESGMYVAILGSQVEGSQKFKRWLTREVLPAIRKTGSYSRYPAHPETTALPSKRELAQWVIDAEDRAERAEAKVAELAVPASAWNELAEAAGDYSVADAAKVLSRDPNITIGRDRLFEFMRGWRWVYRDGGRWRAYQTQVNVGRLTEKVGKPFVRDGRMLNGEPTVRITPKGLAVLHARLGAEGQLALAVVS